jgi:hypothetical protein
MSDAVRDYLDAIIPADAAGWLVGAVGYGGHLDEHGKYAFDKDKFVPYAYLWPDRADAVIAKIQAEALRGDVYVCPYLMRDRKRAKGNAAGRRLVHSDVDSGRLDLAAVRGLGGFAIGSGTPGHGHVYVPLSHVVMPAQHELLCKGLAAYLGGDMAKISDNDLLRPPGTFNYKPTVAGGDPAPVELL